MSAYGALAAWYDALTRDVDYAAFADFYEQCFQQGCGESHTLLDFCCGTGTLTRLMAARGYEMIATDGSPDMLMQAQAHNADLPPDAVAPLLLCQEASELDLYGTVDAAYCSLDGIDYLPPEELPEVLHRLHPVRASGRDADPGYPRPGVVPRARRRHIRRRDGRCPVSLAGGV